MILAALVLAAQAPTPPAAHLGEIRMHLFYAETGQLSPDISPPNAFAGWNTVIGGGDATGHADDLVVLAEVRTEGEQFVERPLSIVARGARGRVLGQRRFASVLTSAAGRAYQALWLNNVTCAGDVQVTVTYGAETRTETLQLHCGE